MGGGGSAPMASSSGWSTSSPTLYNWAQILPPWTQGAQKQIVPWLTSRAMQGGLTAPEKTSLWGEMQNQINSAAGADRRGVLTSLLKSGMSPTSPAAVSLLGNVENQRLVNTTKATSDFAKLKMGARSEAIGQMLGSAYANMPFGIGYVSNASQSSKQSGGGSK